MNAQNVKMLGPGGWSAVPFHREGREWKRAKRDDESLELSVFSLYSFPFVLTIKDPCTPKYSEMMPGNKMRPLQLLGASFE